MGVVFLVMFSVLKLLILYVLVIVGVVLFYCLVLDVWMDEFFVFWLFFVILLGILVYEYFCVIGK